MRWSTPEMPEGRVIPSGRECPTRSGHALRELPPRVLLAHGRDSWHQARGSNDRWMYLRLRLVMLARYTCDNVACSRFQLVASSGLSIENSTCAAIRPSKSASGGINRFADPNQQSIEEAIDERGEDLVLTGEMAVDSRTGDTRSRGDRIDADDIETPPGERQGHRRTTKTIVSRSGDRKTWGNVGSTV